MLISKALAQAPEIADAATDIAGQVPAAPSPMMNLGMLVIMVILFYVLLIMPQQKRFKEHSKMLSDLNKGDDIVTGGGLIGKITKVVDDNEVEVDLGNKLIVRVKRNTISGKAGEAPAALKAAEPKTKEAKKSDDKKPAAKKPTAKKTAAKKATAKKATTKKTAPKKAEANKEAE